MQTRLSIPAKINLYLGVGQLRPDGYHELETIFHSVDIVDDVIVETSDKFGHLGHPAGARHARICLTHDQGNLIPNDGRNLMVKATKKLCDYVGYETVLAEDATDSQKEWQLLKLQVKKRIPIAGGMAGGSANAAGVLLALNDHWQLDLSKGELLEIAATLGADVPFCLMGGTAIGTGTGTNLVPVLARNVFHFVVGTSQEPLLTPAVYKAFDSLPAPVEHSIGPTLEALTSGDPNRLAEAIVNDLELAALVLRPELGEKLSAMTEAGALRSFISGSGPTVLGIAQNKTHAEEIACKLEGEFTSVNVVSSCFDGPQWEV